MAKQDFLFSYLQAGETSISNLLLHHYREIGMTSGELLVYLELKSYIGELKTPASPGLRKICRLMSEPFMTRFIR